jgi:DNA-3-methyladenine glycosylase II
MTTVKLPLPAHFSVSAFLHFHGRDSHAVSERVDALTLHKAIIFNLRPCILKMDFNQVGHVITNATDTTAPALTRQASAMLGLNQPVEVFETAIGTKPPLNTLVQRQRGLRVPQSATPFEALTWAIIGQQISVSAATAIRRRFIQLASPVRHDGLHCYPDAATVCLLTPDALRSVGFSATKADTLLAVSRLCRDQQLLPETLHLDAYAEQLERNLLEIRGLGPWSVNYTLLRGYGFLDGSLHADVAVQKALQMLLGQPERPTARVTRDWLADFTPWRALVAAHLWQSLSTQA